MIASVYIKDGNIHFYNEDRKFTDLGGLAYELGRPFLDFICYEPERFDECFTFFADAFDDEGAHAGAMHPKFKELIESQATDILTKEIYVYFYYQMFFEFIYNFIESPGNAIKVIEMKIPGAAKKLEWASEIIWPVAPPGKIYCDKEKRLHRAALDVVVIMSEHFKMLQRNFTKEVDLLIWFRENKETITGSPMDYLFMLEVYHKEYWGDYIYIDNPFKTFFGIIQEPEIVQLYEINIIADLCRFEFIKMIEHDIFIKKCKNCEHFFIPRGRADTEYCNRQYKETGRKCNEIGAMIRYEKNVAENPILKAHKKAYRRFNSRVRNKKMTQTEFLNWSNEASNKRDMCLAGEISFDDFIAWLEQGRVRKPRSKD